MYLKALEIQGFKSFATKTRLSFEKAVTAIVGPNGSGKSNISDALRWVMGEQSTRALRGGKMEDVIFGGTEKRGPLGFAEVSLILDNTDHAFDMETSEVMVTRRYYRSGESEYYINKKTCRLKDINELFMDTGLGREGYSIIGQGRIDEILSVKSTERREIFEEAAGISRFRHRKEEAEGKLLRAQDNLLRVNDKISELEMQVEPLRRQSEQAKKYLVFRDELRGLEIDVWADSLEKLAAGRTKLQEDTETAQKHRDMAESQRNALYAEEETFSAKMQEKDVAAEQVRSEIAGEEALSAENDSAAAVLRANRESHLASIERLKSEMNRQGDQKESLSQQILEKKQRLSAIVTDRENLSREKEELISRSAAAESNAGEAEKEIALLMERENRFHAEIAAQESAVSAWAGTVQETEDRSAARITAINQAREKLEETRKEEKENSEALAKAQADKDSAANRIRGYQLRMESRSRKLTDLTAKRTKLTMDFGAAERQLGFLNNLEKEYNGYSKAVKVVMQEAGAGRLRGVCGPVANLLKAEDDYALAVETAMGAAMQNIVVEQDADGRDGIQLLKRRDAGRCTFMPVSTMRGSRLSEQLEGEPGFVGLAADLVQFDRKYEGIFLNLLGRVAVTENLDHAIRLGRKYGNRFRIVTLDGQQVNTGGSMTGGSAVKSAGLLSRANEIEKLTETVTALGGELKAAEEEEEKARRDKAAAEYELGIAQEEMRGYEDAVLKLTEAQGHFKLLLTALEEAFGKLETEAAETDQRISQAEENIRLCRKKIADAEKELAHVEALLEEKTGASSEIAALRASILEKISENSAAFASLDAEELALEKAAMELQQLQVSIEGGVEKQRFDIQTLENEIAEIDRRLAENETGGSVIRSRIDGLRRKLTALTEARLQLEAQRTRQSKRAQEKNDELNALMLECSRLEQRLHDTETEEKQILDKLWDSYELTRTDAFAMCRPVEDLRASSKRIGELKRDIGRLGNVNVGAIDEFERVNSRYTYLTEQRDDITAAGKELEGIIKDITVQMREIFAQEFENIRQGFKTTFTEMFGGGRADLTLEDPENILECGIDIKVQPPGKSLKTITLLSGGEKAFVAIALYFAILRVRPTPFVIMDEIEAALDEANVVRFAQYLRNLAAKTQFLLITHRRGTMEEADVLYGVTMQEQGVTQVLAVDLEEAEKTLGK